MIERASWKLEPGDEIVPGRIAFQRLGGGNSYEVYLAWDDALHALVVAKLVRPDQLDDRSVRRQLRREADVLGQLSHPVVVRCFDFIDEGECPHLVLEHLEGPTLRRLLRRFGPLAMEQTVTLALQLCSALHYIAGRGFVHLDIKPANIVMGSPPRLIDLSVARRVEDARSMTRPIGTAAYMAPEQCEPGVRGEVGTASDIFGLGVTLFEAVTGTRPFQQPSATSNSEEMSERRYRQLDEQPVITDHRVPELMAEQIYRCLDPEPAARPTASQLADALEPLVAEMPRPTARWRRFS